jgi:RimJ/RimL family protein N-acetyltransferase
VTAPPPYRIATERLVLRCWEPRDAPLQLEALVASLEHLRAWMPWAHDEPQPLRAQVDKLRGFRARFDRGEEFIYGIFDADETQVLGATGLHRRVGEGAFEIGYWIRADRLRERLATEAAAALTRVAFAICGVDRVEIRVDKENTASAGVPRRLGYREEARLRRRLPSPTAGGEPRDVIVYTLFADELAASGAARAALTAFDAAGERVL